MGRRDGGSLADRVGSIAWTIFALRDLGMPSEEIVLILEADDPEIVHRYLELHLERLEEHLADHRRTVAMLERLLVERSIVAAARPREREAAGQ